MSSQIFITIKIDNINYIHELIEKFIEPKTRKLLKSQKLAKSQNLSKSKNLLEFNIKIRSNFLISGTKKIFNHL